MSDPPVEIRLVLVDVNVIDGVQAQPGVEGEAVLVWPLCNGRKSNGLIIHKHRVLLYVSSSHGMIFTILTFSTDIKSAVCPNPHVENMC